MLPNSLNSFVMSEGVGTFLLNFLRTVLPDPLIWTIGILAAFSSVKVEKWQRWLKFSAVQMMIVKYDNMTVVQ